MASASCIAHVKSIDTIAAGIRLKGVKSVNVGRLRFSSNEVDALSDHHIRGVLLVRPPVNESGGRRVL